MIPPRATKTLRNVRSAWGKEQRVDIKNDQIAESQVNLMVTFALDDQPQPGGSRSPASIRIGKRFSAGVSGHENLGS